VPVALADNWKFATAMVPFGMDVAFSPKTRQLVPLQLSDFPAEDADAPTSTVTPVIPDGRMKLHCAAVGNAPPEEEILIGSETMEPARPDPDAIVKETAGCANAGSAARIRDKTHVFADIIVSLPCPDTPSESLELNYTGSP